jgi:serine/threonine protein kinase/WD40 repeat protein
MAVASSTCPECGGPLRASAAGGLCPRCLLRFTLSETAGEPACEDAPPVAGMPRRFGDYELRRELGRGGMGVVYEACDLRLNRTVALKMLLPARLASPVELERFRREAEAVAALDHPNILPVYDVGEIQGQPFFTMKLAESGSLADRRGTGAPCVPHPASRSAGGGVRGTDAARLLAAVARAVHYAHQRGIQHRDLKPHNILLDAGDRPYVGDFGLAKFRDSDRALTRSSSVLGSPAYMSPEQAVGETKNLTNAADIYSLGAILYELLTGHPPFAAENVPALLRKIVEDEPRPIANPDLPSASGCGGEPANRKSATASPIDPDLATICLKCLNKEPARRYASAEALAEDLGRWLRDEPVLARPVSATERAGRWCRRRPALASLAAALVLVTLLGLAGVLSQWRRAQREAEAARLNAYAADISAASAAWQEGDWGRARQLLARYERMSPDLRGFEWFLLWEATRDPSTRSVQAHEFGIRQARFTPDGSALLTSAREGVSLWEASSFSNRWRLRLTNGAASGFAFLPGTAQVAVATGREISILDLATGRVLRQLPAAGNFAWREVLVAGSNLVVADRDRLSLLDLETGRERVLPNSSQPVALSPDRTTLVANAGLGQFALLSPHDGRRLGELPAPELGWLHTAPVLTFSADGRWLAAGDQLGRIKVWHWPARRAATVVDADTPCLTMTLAFSPDSQRLLAGFGDQSVRQWRTEDWQPGPTLRGHGNEVWTLAGAPRGDGLVSGDKDGVLKLWEGTAATPVTRFGPVSNVTEFVLSLPSSAYLRLRTDRGDQLACLEFASNRPVLFTHLPPGAAFVLAHSGHRAAWTSTNGILTLWDLAASQPLATAAVGADDKTTPVGFTTDDSQLVTTTTSGTLGWWQLPELRCVHRLERQRRPVFVASDYFAVFDQPMVPSLRRRRDGAELARLEGHRETIDALVGSPDGRWLASACEDGTVRLWRLPGGRLAHVLRAQKQGVFTVDFSPDSRTLAAGGQDGTVTLWNVDTGRFLALLHPAGGATQVSAVRFSRSAQSLAALLGDGTIRVWPAPPVGRLRQVGRAGEDR